MGNFGGSFFVLTGTKKGVKLAEQLWRENITRLVVSIFGDDRACDFKYHIVGLGSVAIKRCVYGYDEIGYMSTLRQ